jgi:uncharacterized membrane-anchored protein
MSVLSIATLIVNCILTVVVTWLVKKATSAFDDAKARQEESERRQAEENKALKSGMLAILRDRLFAACFAALKQGEITADDYENIESLHQQYHALGGNHTGDTLYTRASGLQIVERYTEEEQP